MRARSNKRCSRQALLGCGFARNGCSVLAAELRRYADHGGLVKNLDGLTMFVSSTADNGIVNGDTRLVFTQRGTRVGARYSGGHIARGLLVGQWADDTLHFRYQQLEDGCAIHAGHSVCSVQELPDGRLQLVEHFVWSTRAGSGVNVFEELPKVI
jgi:hypothetical protein